MNENILSTSMDSWDHDKFPIFINSEEKRQLFSPSESAINAFALVLGLSTVSGGIAGLNHDVNYLFYNQNIPSYQSSNPLEISNNYDMVFNNYFKLLEINNIKKIIFDKFNITTIGHWLPHEDFERHCLFLQCDFDEPTSRDYAKLSSIELDINIHLESLINKSRFFNSISLI